MLVLTMVQRRSCGWLHPFHIRLKGPLYMLLPEMLSTAGRFGPVSHSVSHSHLKERLILGAMVEIARRGERYWQCPERIMVVVSPVWPPSFAEELTGLAVGNSRLGRL